MRDARARRRGVDRHACNRERIAVTEHLRAVAELTASFVVGFRSAKTRSNYTANLRDWFPWTEATGIEPWQAQRRAVEAYVGRLEDAGYAPNTICQRIATLSSFYRWAVAEDHLTRNPVDGARRPRKPAASTAQGRSRHEVTDWLDAAETRGGGAYACTCLLALNGLRVGELIHPGLSGGS